MEHTEHRVLFTTICKRRIRFLIFRFSLPASSIGATTSSHEIMLDLDRLSRLVK